MQPKQLIKRLSDNGLTVEEKQADFQNYFEAYERIGGRLRVGKRQGRKIAMKRLLRELNKCDEHTRRKLKFILLCVTGEDVRPQCVTPPVAQLGQPVPDEVNFCMCPDNPARSAATPDVMGGGVPAGTGQPSTLPIRSIPGRT